MNTVALRFLAIILAIAVLTFMFAWFSKKELLQRVKETIDWLLKVSFFDFVQLIIFIKPLKKQAIVIGVIVWLILVFVIGRHLIIIQPEITEIPGPYIPMIGYVSYLSVLFIIRFVLGISRQTD